ncbi:phosphoribosylaminoimidazolesuccinocarboxamide synthase [Candidatus Uhrbacteria bacterium]|nr:phosphoribosylaminoimidazolesuccinocarboxamide synthase [Candidatus Uhrbacteria bacterium]
MASEVPFYSGKVRDIYDQGDTLKIVTTNRLSAFDRIICEVPSKGAALNSISAWWFEKTAHIIPNHCLATPEPNIMIVKKCRAIPLEIVVRGYITGTTDTSMWVKYCKSEREFDGLTLPEGMKKNQQLPRPVLTPTTKEQNHDRPITEQQIISQGILTEDQWQYLSGKAIELYLYGVSVARERGLILVDTKYEFGFDKDGNILLIDEIHTPDSSRYWKADTYEARLAQGLEPENFDKEFIRLWIKEHSDPYSTNPLPPIPGELIGELSGRYVKIYSMLTGKSESELVT